MWVEFTDSMGNYEAGQRVNLHDSVARRAIKIDRACAIETVTERPTEHAAKRTRDPGRHGWEYRGHGWWQSPEGQKVRGSKDASLADLMTKIRGD